MLPSTALTSSVAVAGSTGMVMPQVKRLQVPTETHELPLPSSPSATTQSGATLPQPSAAQWQANRSMMPDLATTTRVPQNSAVSVAPTPSSPIATESATLKALHPPALPLKQWLQNGEAVIYALNIRTFGAEDKDGDGKISAAKGENGTFLSSIKRLPELKAEGFNTLHVLPVTAIGQSPRLGEKGSLYSPASYTDLNPQFDVPNNGMTALQEFKTFVDAAHQQGIAVMVDLPSCASYDLVKTRPDLIPFDENGKPLTPYNWVDVAMMKRDSPEMRTYFNQFADLMANQAGVDGFRCDIARARTPEFWKDLTAKYPEHGWFAESYIEEDDSPIKNLPRDYPGQLLQCGFDSFYGQFHIFYNMSGQEYTDYVASTWNHIKDMKEPKALTNTVYTHDDHSLMEHGGVPEIKLALAMENLQPFSNIYVMDGLLTADPKTYDIFDDKPPAKGDHPELIEFFKAFKALRDVHADETLHGSYTPLPVETKSPENQIIANTRNGANGKSLLVLANKDINTAQEGTISVPGLIPGQALPRDLVPHEYFPETGEKSQFNVSEPGKLTVKLTPGAINVFEIDGRAVTAQLPTLQPWIPPEKRIKQEANAELAADEVALASKPVVPALLGSTTGAVASPLTGLSAPKVAPLTGLPLAITPAQVGGTTV
jgi:hypothetical protein